MAAIPNCLAYSTTSSTSTIQTCKTCNNSYYLNTVDVNTTCVAGGIEGCITYSSSTVCTGCLTTDYYLSGAKCVKHVKANNCLTYSGSNYNECATCAVGFYPFKYNTNCSAITVTRLASDCARSW